MNPPPDHPPKPPSEASIEPLVSLPGPAPAPGEKPGDAGEPNVSMETRVPASGSPKPTRRAKTEDFAFLSRIPTRKPETFDGDAIMRAVWMVGGLAMGLWLITFFARPNAPVVPAIEPPPEAVAEEAPPIVMPGKEPLPVPEAISLTPEPAWTPAPVETPAFQAPVQPPVQAPALRTPMRDPAMPMQAPALRAPAMRAPVAQPRTEYAMPDAGGAPPPTSADMPDPSNLFPSE